MKRYQGLNKFVGRRWLPNSLFAFILYILSACVNGTAVADAKVPGGQAWFEILGMLKEYGSRDSDGKKVETFYPHESAIAAHFESLLHEYCSENNINMKVERTIDSQGFITFSSPAIAVAIDRDFTKGALDESVFDNATKEDLLRYVLGAYTRYGDENGAAVIYGADAPRKLHTVGLIFSRLGCTHITLYSTKLTMVPTSFVLLFSPTTIVKAALGVRKEVSVSDLKDFHGELQIEESFSGSNRH